MSSWGEQFRSGDQGSNRKVFAASSYRVCPECNGTDITCDVHVAGCRHNGDGYGTEVYTCKTCSWNTSFHYDEADSGSSYHYETDYWNKVPSNVNPDEVGNPLTQEDREIYTKMKKLAPIEAVRNMMQVRGFKKKDIDLFLAE